MARSLYYAVVNCRPDEVDKLLILINAVILGLTGNALFPTPLVTIITLTALRDALYTAKTNASGVLKSQATLDILEAKAKETHAALVQESFYVNGICKGNKEQVNTSGFPHTKDATKAVLPTEPVFTVKRGTMPGGFDIVLAKPVPKGVKYDAQIMIFPAGGNAPGFNWNTQNWTMAAENCTYTKLKIAPMADFPLGSQVAIRLVPFNTAGKGTPSDGYYYVIN